MDLIREKQLRFFLTVINLWSWPMKFKNISIYVWIHPLRNRSSCHYWASAPIKRIWKHFGGVWMRDAWFPKSLVGAECPRRRLPAKGPPTRPTPTAATCAPPSPPKHNIQISRAVALHSCQTGKGVLQIFQALPLLIVFGRSFFFFLVHSAC